VSQCPTAFGRRAGFKTAVDMLRWFKENSVLIQQAKKMAESNLAGKIMVGEFARRELPSFTDTLYETIKEARKSA